METTELNQTSAGSSGESFDTAQRPSVSRESLSSGNNGAPDGVHHPEAQSTESAEPGGQKRESRYERTKREKALFRQQQAQFQAERAQFAKERAELEEAKKPKRDYSLADLKKYRQAWEDEGKFDLVEAADAKIAEIEEEEKSSKKIVELPAAGTPAHKAEWNKAEAELAEADPEFMRSGTRLDGRLREIMGSQDGEIYRQHPRGIIAAYHRAKMEILQGDYKVAQDEIQGLKAELQRLTGLTSINGGAPGRPSVGKAVESIRDFARLSSSDMRKRLKDGARSNASMPWL